MVWDSTGLMELSEKIVEVNHCLSILNEFRPISQLRAVISFKFICDLRKIPWESKNITMFTLTKL